MRSVNAGILSVKGRAALMREKERRNVSGEEVMLTRVPRSSVCT